MLKLPKIAITMGDPAGIGPELAVKAAADSIFKDVADLTVYGCPDIINSASAKFTDNKPLKINATGDLKFANVPIGKADSRCGIEARNAVVKAVEDALSGIIDAIVTGPINKTSINMAGIPFTGHTELIAGLCGSSNFAMMQSAGCLRIAFVTTHIPLKKVSSSITLDRIVNVAILLNEAIKKEGLISPRLAAAALNPHAGENGFMGNEDELIVKPALEKLRAEGINIDGPFPPDTLFIKEIRDKYDGILAMYHDQGHIPFKMLAFNTGVNSSLGLPIIRTSVDHGTAFEIAWKGLAGTGSLYAAIRMAVIRVKAE